MSASEDTMHLARTSMESPKHFHIFGHGISFSMSPAIQTAAFRHYGLSHTYDICETESIDQVADLVHDPSFGGASVTMPHKLAVHKFCDEQTQHARRIGAINTLVLREAGEGERRRRVLVGENTDWSGLRAIIKQETESWTDLPRVGLVIGAGGASRAALYALHQFGLKRIYIVNRTVANAEKIADDFGSLFHIAVLPDLQSLTEPPEIIVGTIPADRSREEDFRTLFPASRGLCIDMSYKPRKTPLLAAAEKHSGWRMIQGVEVLLYQAFDQFELWTGLTAPVDAMAQQVNVHVRSRQTELASRNGKTLAH